MYEFMHDLLSDHKGGEIFRCFGIWHFCYILFVLIGIAVICLLLKNKKDSVKQNAVSTLIDIAFGLYIADFFLMPFAYEEIDIEKLPFHVCTAMCVMCFLSRHVRPLRKYSVHFALLGFISNLVYLIYPAGVMWHAVHPLSYRVIQTLMFHGIMTAYGFFAVAFDREGLRFRKCRNDLAVLVLMTVWAIIGNLLYNGEAGSYSAFYNWFFVVEDPFGIFDKSIAPFVMPFVDIVLFFAAEMIVYVIYNTVRRLVPNKECGEIQEL